MPDRSTGPVTFTIFQFSGLVSNVITVKISNFLVLENQKTYVMKETQPLEGTQHLVCKDINRRLSSLYQFF